MTETAEIVAWLRKEAAELSISAERRAKAGFYRDAYEQDSHAKAMVLTASQIERGEHKEKTDGE